MNVLTRLGVPQLSPARPVLIAGPTASGKSALALAIAEAQGGVIVNADASQVYDCWQALTARPGPEDTARAPHALYGHLPYDAPYSVGVWLREVAPLLNGPRPIVVGGTGLSFMALTEGLSDIPPTPPGVRATADALPLRQLLAGLDAETANALDPENRARVQRAWEVQTATGKGMAYWHTQRSAALLPGETALRIVLAADRDWLNARIAGRFGAMLAGGALDEARAMLDRFDPALQSCKAIGAPELIAHLRGNVSLAKAQEAATIATRQYAKRQRTWMRARMSDWHMIDAQIVHNHFTNQD